MKKKISIIVPVYNSANTLERCVTSLTQQDYPNIEIVLVNDGSKDHSLTICNRLANMDGRIQVIDKMNGGVSTARNAGIAAATGDYVMFVDSDDWVCRNYCSLMERYFSKEHLVMCGFETFFHGLDWKEKVLGNGSVEELKKSEFLRYREIGIGSPWNKLFARAVIMENNLRFPESLALGEDLAFVLGYLQAIPGDIWYVHENLYIYQMDQVGSLSKRAPTMRQNELFFEVLASAVSSLSNNSPSMIQLRNQIVMQDFEKTMIALAKNKQYTFIQKCKIARDGVATKAFRTCCGDGVGSSNSVYQWLYKQRLAELLMVYLVMRDQKENTYE